MAQSSTSNIMVFLTLLNAGMLFYSFIKRHQHPMAKPLVLICFFIFQWSLALTLRSLTSSPAQAIIYHELKFIAAAVLPVATLVIIMHYIGLGRLVQFKYIAALSIIPLFTIILSQTNSWHHIFRLGYHIVYQGDGSFYIQARNNYWFYVHVIYSYTLWMINLVLLLKYYFKHRKTKNFTTIILILAILFPFVTNLLDLFAWVKAYDLTLFAMTVSAAFLIFSTFFYSSHDLVPLARLKLVEYLPNPIFIYNQNFYLTDFNQAAYKLAGLNRARLHILKREEILQGLSNYPEPTENALYWSIDSPSKERKAFSLETQTVHDADGNVTAYVDIFTDVTELEKAKRNIEKIADTDLLTGLYNRNYFENKMHILDQESDHPLALIIADIDGLKYINDTFGHSTGDEIIRQAANTLRSAVRSQDMAARIGGDEFVIIMEDINKAEVDQVIKNIKSHCQSFSNNEAVLSMCLGYAFREKSSLSMTELFRLADQNMYTFKRSKLEARSAVSRTVY